MLDGIPEAVSCSTFSCTPMSKSQLTGKNLQLYSGFGCLCQRKSRVWRLYVYIYTYIYVYICIHIYTDTHTFLLSLGLSFFICKMRCVKLEISRVPSSSEI